MYFVWLSYKIKKFITPQQQINPQKILVLNLTGIGDTVCLTPFLGKIKDAFMNAEIWGCFLKGVIELQSSFIELDGYIPHKSFKKTLNQIRDEKFDMILIPGWALKHSILALLSNAKFVLGYLNDLTFTNRYINRFRIESIGMKVDNEWQNMKECHLSERPNLILKSLNIEPVNRRELKNNSITKRKKYLVVHAGADFEGRLWPVEKFAELLNRFISELKGLETIFLIGGTQDFLLNQKIIEETGNKVTNLAGKLSLIKTKELIEKSSLFIGNDSGPMHIAAFVGTPTIGLMGPNLPEISGPVGENTAYIYKSFNCSPCNQRICHYNYRCIKSITVDEVFQKATELWEKNY